MDQIIEIMAEAMHGIESSLGRMQPWAVTHTKHKEVWRDRAREAISALKDGGYVIAPIPVLEAARKNIDPVIQYKLIDAILAAEAADLGATRIEGGSPSTA